MTGKGSIWLIVGIVVFFLVLGIIVSSVIESELVEEFGKAIKEGKIPTVNSEDGPRTCKDDDGGKSYFTAGTVTLSETSDEYNDICDSATLTEYFCEVDLSESIEYECPSGCNAGACDDSPYTIDDCTDDDGGANYFTSGVTTNTSGSYEDKCLTVQGLSVLVKEYFCKKDENEVVRIEFIIYQCKKSCENAACTL